MYILVTNDDGIHAKGINALARVLEEEHEVLVVAPDEQRSATGHSITIFRPLRIKKEKLPGIKGSAFSVDGTPADCVRIAIDQLAEKKIDMVVSGVNSGFNIGIDVLYSGTVSAAIEAAIAQTPSLAVSLEYTEDIKQYELAAKYAAKILASAKENNIKSDLVLNINVPLLTEEKIKGIKVCRIGNPKYTNYFVEIPGEGETGHRVFEVMGNLNTYEHEDTDNYFIEEGYVTLTPLHYDLTNHGILDEVEEWKIR